MSEQNDPVIRVKDRRMFNPDGSLRPVEPGEEDDRRTEAPPAAPTQEPERPAGPAPEIVAAESEPVARPENRDHAPSRPGEPSLFSDLVVNLASQAAMYLGLVDNPLAQQMPADLPAARQMIDILSMLKEKTRGNLTAEETRLLERILADLQMQYVSMTATRR